MLSLPPHTDDPRTCPACVAEGRDLFDTYTFAEMEPLGPTNAGDAGSPDTQMTEAFGRRFYRQREDGTVAVADVVFYGEAYESGAPSQTVRVTTFRICSDLKDVSGTQLFEDEQVHTLWDEPGPPTDERARELCGEYDPAELAWNGGTAGHLECDPSPAALMRVCKTHPENHRAEYGSMDNRSANFACDRGMNWLFILDIADEEFLGGDPVNGGNEVRVANLTRVLGALRSQVEHADLAPPEMVKVMRYVSPGIVQPLVWRPVPHGNAPYGFVDGDDRKALVADRCYELVGPHPDGGGRLTRYLEFSVQFDGDA